MKGEERRALVSVGISGMSCYSGLRSTRSYWNCSVLSHKVSVKQGPDMNHHPRPSTLHLPLSPSGNGTHTLWPHITHTLYTQSHYRQQRLSWVQLSGQAGQASRAAWSIEALPAFCQLASEPSVGQSWTGYNRTLVDGEVRVPPQTLVNWTVQITVTVATR